MGVLRFHRVRKFVDFFNDMIDNGLLLLDGVLRGLRVDYALLEIEKTLFDLLDHLRSSVRVLLLYNILEVRDSTLEHPRSDFLRVDSVRLDALHKSFSLLDGGLI